MIIIMCGVYVYVYNLMFARKINKLQICGHYYPLYNKYLMPYMHAHHLICAQYLLGPMRVHPWLEAEFFGVSGLLL